MILIDGKKTAAELRQELKEDDSKFPQIKKVIDSYWD